MGERGATYSEDVGAFAEEIVDDLRELGALSWRKMFGGAGIFVDEKMFALVDSDAQLHLKVDDSNRARYEAMRAAQHPRMPYFAVPGAVLDDHTALLEWAAESVEVARSG
jgi:DNA transformation protein